jgi:glycolate oxidase FAD binding subunit
MPIVIRGAGTKIAWGRPPERVGAVLSMRRLDRVLDHRPGDLTVTVEAGATLHQLNTSLAAHGQWLPVDAPFAARATIGGLLATNDSGPLRHRFGTPRDLLIGIRLATADGRLASAGGRVVKNVAGYDLGKLVTGSFGALAAIVSATFKLSPRPAASATIVVRCAAAGAAAAVARTVGESQLEPVAFEIRAARGGSDRATSLLLRFATFEAALDEQISAARALLGGLAPGVHVLTGSDEAAAWDDHAAVPPSGGGAVVRVSWLPAALGAVLDTLDAAGRIAPVEMIGRAGVGAGLIRLGENVESQARIVELLRRSPHLGHVVLVRATAQLKAAVDVWGTQANRTLLRAIRSAMDPAGILGAGRGPI